jgi:hypothetical protein
MSASSLRSLRGFSWALPLIAVSLLGGSAGAVTKVVYTGTITDSTSPELTSGASPAYSVDQKFWLSFSINESFNPNLNASCYLTSGNRYNNNQTTCNQSLLSDVSFAAGIGTFSPSSAGVQILIPQSSRTQNLGFTRNLTFNTPTGAQVVSNNSTWEMISWNVPTTYTFSREPTPYMVYPYGPTLLSPSALVLWYYNTSYYRNYAISSPPTVTINFYDPESTATTQLYFSATQMDIIGEAPAPLPFLGAVSAFGFSRRLRRRCRPACKPRSSSSSGK